MISPPFLAGEVAEDPLPAHLRRKKSALPSSIRYLARHPTTSRVPFLVPPWCTQLAASPEHPGPKSYRP